MTVLRLVRTSNQDTIDAARFLLQQALRGKVVAFTGAFRDDHGVEESISTGAYKAHPDQAVIAALRFSVEALKAS